jgi:hypothetical protein
MQFGKKMCIDVKKFQAEKYLSKRFTRIDYEVKRSDRKQIHMKHEKNASKILNCVGKDYGKTFH